jgi:hypothetical protein
MMEKTNEIDPGINSIYMCLLVGPVCGVGMISYLCPVQIKQTP